MILTARKNHYTHTHETNYQVSI